MKLVWGTVEEVTKFPSGARRLYELRVKTDEDNIHRALAYERLTGTLAPADRVLINTSAVDLNLGTGGFAFVVTSVRAGELPSGVVLDDPAPNGGHIMKMRYSPLQRDILSVEEEGYPGNEIMKSAEVLKAMPVVCCGLHSHVPLVAAAIKAQRPQAKVAYLMTDQAALAAEMSNLLNSSKELGLIDVSLTVGQAFGGDLEAVSLHSGLLALKYIEECDVVIVAIGPGVVGTGTPFGHGGISQGEALNAVASLEGHPIAVLRMSSADARPRHRGISHHSITALSKIALAPVSIPYPELDADEFNEMYASLNELKARCVQKHTYVALRSSHFNEKALKGLRVSSMGRGYDDDPLFFEAAWAAGQFAADLLFNA